MKLIIKFKFNLFIVLVTSVNLFPVFALERITPTTPAINPLPSDSSNDENSIAKEETTQKSKPKVKFFPYVTSVVTCTVVGTPVALVRHTVDEIKQGEVDLVGKYNNIIFKTIATGISTPYGLLSGFMQSPFWGIRNSVKYSKEKPFSKEAMGLGKL